MTEKSSDQGGAELRKQHGGSEKPEVHALRGPHEHAVAIGAFRERKERAGAVVAAIGGRTPNLGEYSWQHQAAAALHGWVEHEHHEAKPVDLSLDDYKKALLAASSPVVRAANDTNVAITVKAEKDGEKPRDVRVAANKGEVIDLRKLGIITEDLANKGVPFTADYEPHAPALSKHAAHAKNAEAAEAANAPTKADDDSHLFAKA